MASSGPPASVQQQSSYQNFPTQSNPPQQSSTPQPPSTTPQSFNDPRQNFHQPNIYESNSTPQQQQPPPFQTPQQQQPTPQPQAQPQQPQPQPQQPQQQPTPQPQTQVANAQLHQQQRPNLQSPSTTRPFGVSAPPYHVPATPAEKAREAQRLALLLEINSFLLAHLQELQTNNKHLLSQPNSPGAQAPQQQQLNPDGTPKPQFTPEFIIYSRLLQANLAWIATVSAKGKSGQSPTLVGPAILDAPGNASAEIAERYKKLRELFPGWRGVHQYQANQTAAVRSRSGSALSNVEQAGRIPTSMGQANTQGYTQPGYTNFSYAGPPTYKPGSPVPPLGDPNTMVNYGRAPGMAAGGGPQPQTGGQQNFSYIPQGQ